MISSISCFLPGGFLFLQLLLQVLDMLLQLLSFLRTLQDLLLLLFYPGLHVVDDLLHLLLSGRQPGSHLLSLSAQLRFGLELLGKDVLLLEGLLVLLIEVLHLLLVVNQPLRNLLELSFFLHDFLIILGNLEQRLDFSVESPPLPVPQLQVGGAVPLQDSDGVQLLDSLLVVPSSQQTAAVGLELDDEVRDPQVSLLLQVSQHAGPEEDLGLTDPEETRVQLQSLDHLLTGLLPVHESLGDDVGGEELVSLSELLEGDPVGESLTTDPDALEDTVASQLIKDKQSVDLAGLLLVVGDDAPHEVGV